jgi:hypothetical protein
VKLYPGGTAMSRGNNGSKPPTVKRGVVSGWSTQAAARHVKWLMSVDPGGMPEGSVMYAYTLTVGPAIPATSADFHRLREMWLKRVERAVPGALWCWVMEWQARGAPHLHGVLVVPDTPEVNRAVLLLVYAGWSEVAEDTKALPVAQDVKRIADRFSGWLQYLSKHIGRGSKHMQRKAGAMPPGWASSGRLWGHSQGWPTAEQKLQMDEPAWYELRRLVHAWAMADARSEKDPEVRARRLRYLKRRRQVTRDVSRHVGLREWVPPRVMGRLIAWLTAQGYEVTDTETGEIL